MRCSTVPVLCEKKGVRNKFCRHAEMILPIARQCTFFSDASFHFALANCLRPHAKAPWSFKVDRSVLPKTADHRATTHTLDCLQVSSVRNTVNIYRAASPANRLDSIRLHEPSRQGAAATMVPEFQPCRGAGIMCCDTFAGAANQNRSYCAESIGA